MGALCLDLGPTARSVVYVRMLGTAVRRHHVVEEPPFRFSRGKKLGGVSPDTVEGAPRGAIKPARLDDDLVEHAALASMLDAILRPLGPR